MTKNKTTKPQWAPEGAGSEFASNIVPPSAQSDSYKKLQSPKKKDSLTVSDYKDGILSRNKTILARAITLIESNAEKHFDMAQALIREILPYTSNSIRIGITGVPGAGKSTFIETFGLYLIDKGKSPAILAIDPSSTISRGSILGDKTRMERLSRHEKAFIRPSPSGGNLGGVARKTKESMLLCEAAGYDVILVETVGVGQSEVTVRSMVDFFLLILIAGAGDELQGIKKGVMELADAILINKADGENIIPAEATMTIYNNVLHSLANATPGWNTQAYTCSAIYQTGIDSIWQVIQNFLSYTQKTNMFNDRRYRQTESWFESMLYEQVLYQFYHHKIVAENLPLIISAIRENKLTPVEGVKKIMKLYTE
jgi:LAO/AO transport system kinase